MYVNGARVLSNESFAGRWTDPPPPPVLFYLYPVYIQTLQRTAEIRSRVRSALSAVTHDDGLSSVKARFPRERRSREIRRVRRYRGNVGATVKNKK